MTEKLGESAGHPFRGNQWTSSRSYKGSDGGRYLEYALDGNLRNGTLTVEADKKNGYRVRNVFVDPSAQRKGHAMAAYEMANAASVKATGKPLRSSEIGYEKKSGPTSMSIDAVGLWSKLVSIGRAERDGDHYRFIAATSETHGESVGHQFRGNQYKKVGSIAVAKPSDAVASDDGHVSSWHLADRHDFEVNPNYAPQANSSAGDMIENPPKGIYVSSGTGPEFWMHAYGYERPYVAEVRGVITNPPGTKMIGSKEDFMSNAKTVRVLTADEWARENFGEPGWVEDYFRPVGQPAPKIPNGYVGRPVSDMSAAEIKKWERQWAIYAARADGPNPAKRQDDAEQHGEAAGHVFHGNQYVSKSGSTLTVSDETTGAYSGQVDMAKTVHDESGKEVARLSYAMYDGKAHIQMVKAHERGIGAGRVALQSLADDVGMHKINPGMMTEDGSKAIAELAAREGYEWKTVGHDPESVIAKHGGQLVTNTGDWHYAEFSDDKAAKAYILDAASRGAQLTDPTTINGKTWVDAKFPEPETRFFRKPGIAGPEVRFESVARWTESNKDASPAQIADRFDLPEKDATNLLSTFKRFGPAYLIGKKFVPRMVGTHSYDKPAKHKNISKGRQAWDAGKAMREQGVYTDDKHSSAVDIERLGEGPGHEFRGNQWTKGKLSSGKSGTEKAVEIDTNRDANFKKWFGDSKVVNEDGSPMAMYHGTTGEIASFEKKSVGKNYPGYSFAGFYFTNEPKTASLYASAPDELSTPGGNVIKAYVKIEHPLSYVTTRESPSSFIDSNRAVVIHDIMAKRRAGQPVDGVIVRSRFAGDPGLDSTLALVFDPSGIKSAIGNKGTFDPKNADIRHSSADIEVLGDKPGHTYRGNQHTGTFRPLDPLVTSWIKKHTADEVKRTFDGGRAAIRESVELRLSGRISMNQAADRIVERIGLNRVQVRALDSFTMMMEERGERPVIIQREASVYARELLRSRAMTIAAVELKRAQSAAKRMAWAQMHDDGNLPPGAMQRWDMATVGEADCDICPVLDGQIVEIGKPFTAHGEMYDGPPEPHPNCMCSLRLVIVDEEDDQEVSDEIDDPTEEEHQESERGSHIDHAIAAEAADPDPTPGQMESGNYRKGHIRWNGLDITIETPRRGTRKAKDGSWRVEDMPAHYGYLKLTTGADDEHIDIYMGTDTHSDAVFVVDQQDYKTGRFDEHKILLGFDSLDDARDAYICGFSDDHGADRIMAITEVHLDDFIAWLEGDTDKTKPFGASPESLSYGRIDSASADYEATLERLGEAEGHEFRGNQYKKVGSGIGHEDEIDSGTPGIYATARPWLADPYEVSDGDSVPRMGHKDLAAAEKYYEDRKAFLTQKRSEAHQAQRQSPEGSDEFKRADEAAADAERELKDLDAGMGPKFWYERMENDSALLDKTIGQVASDWAHIGGGGPQQVRHAAALAFGLDPNNAVAFDKDTMAPTYGSQFDQAEQVKYAAALRHEYEQSQMDIDAGIEFETYDGSVDGDVDDDDAQQQWHQTDDFATLQSEYADESFSDASDSDLADLLSGDSDDEMVEEWATFDDNKNAVEEEYGGPRPTAASAIAAHGDDREAVNWIMPYDYGNEADNNFKKEAVATILSSIEAQEKAQHRIAALADEEAGINTKLMDITRKATMARRVVMNEWDSKKEPDDGDWSAVKFRADRNAAFDAAENAVMAKLGYQGLADERNRIRKEFSEQRDLRGEHTDKIAVAITDAISRMRDRGEHVLESMNLENDMDSDMQDYLDAAKKVYVKKDPNGIVRDRFMDSFDYDGYDDSDAFENWKIYHYQSSSGGKKIEPIGRDEWPYTLHRSISTTKKHIIPNFVESWSTVASTAKQFGTKHMSESIDRHRVLVYQGSEFWKTHTDGMGEKENEFMILAHPPAWVLKASKKLKGEAT